MIQRDSYDGQGVPPGALLKGVLMEHAGNVPRLSHLHAAYALRAPILDRDRPKGVPNNRLTHGYARYIVSVASSYMGTASYQAEGQERALEPIKTALRAADMDSVDVELARQQSLYGKGVELIYVTEEIMPCSSVLDPRQAFVVYDATVSQMPLMGIHLRQKFTDSGRAKGFQMTVYTRDLICVYHADTLQGLGAGAPDSVTPHYFGRVPMIEYWNNDEETGDFEHVLSLIDAYDALESDRVNDQEQLTNALLVISGAQMLTDEQGRTPAQQLRQDKLLYLPDRDASAQYLTRQGSADAETLREALARDIHKFSMIPDLSDENFAQNASGVAMKYKLLGLETLTRVKERWFRQGLRERLRAYAHFFQVVGRRPLDPDQVRITFDRALPMDMNETAQMVRTLSGMVPEDQLLSQLPFLDKT